MRKKISIIMIIVLVGLLAVGGTMAWFTSVSEPVTNAFTAGTVEIKLVDEFDEENAQNINPGDDYEKEVYVKNIGSKKAYIRVKVEAEFIPAVEGAELDVDAVVTYLVGDWEDDWAKIKGWYYYKKEVAPKGQTGLLIDGVSFNGAGMGNNYQGADFKITIEAQAIQASNDAIEDLWKVNPSDWSFIEEESGV